MTKRLLTFCLLLMLVAPAVLAQKIKQKKVPFDLLVVFRDAYPAATAQHWRKHPEGFLVKFEHLGKQKQVVYQPNLEWVNRESTLTKEELPLPALLHLQQNLPACDVQQVRALESPGNVTLEVMAYCPADKKTQLLRFDRNGRLLKD